MTTDRNLSVMLSLDGFRSKDALKLTVDGTIFHCGHLSMYTEKFAETLRSLLHSVLGGVCLLNTPALILLSHSQTVLEMSKFRSSTRDWKSYITIQHFIRPSYLKGSPKIYRAHQIFLQLYQLHTLLLSEFIEHSSFSCAELYAF
jgi:hypothetical protein